MLCKSCGQEIDTWEVCPHCGTVQADTPAPQPAPVKPADIPARKPSGLAKAALIILCVLGILHMLPVLLENTISDIEKIVNVVERTIDYGFDFFYIAETLLRTGIHALYLLAILIGFILLIARKPKAAILVPVLGALWYLFLFFDMIIDSFRYGYPAEYLLECLPLLLIYLFFVLTFVVMAICILLGKFEWGALFTILPAVFYTLYNTGNMTDLLLSNDRMAYYIRNYGLFSYLETMLSESYIITLLTSYFMTNVLCTAIIFFCIAYVVCVRIKKKQQSA